MCLTLCETYYASLLCPHHNLPFIVSQAVEGEDFAVYLAVGSLYLL